MESLPAAKVSPKHLRFARLAAALAKAVVNDELPAQEALPVLRHQLRKMNTNRALLAPIRSVAAQAVVDRHAEAGEPIPKNGSADALHCDHVHQLSAADLRVWTTVDEWTRQVAWLAEVVCVTAAENYALEQVERAGITGWQKYEAAGVVFLTDAPTLG
jgi:hypothetical protein